MTQLQKGVGSLQANLPNSHPSPGHLAQARTAGGEKPTGRGRETAQEGGPLFLHTGLDARISFQVALSQIL